jgi:threonine dehydrogenase-like Zn-dependent dehydrogenase
MRALTTLPGTPRSLRLEEFPEPPRADGEVLVATRAIGLCGTDSEISAGEYGSAPEGEERLILGHESVGRVLEAPEGSGFAPGDSVVGIVRRPDPVPCANCAVGEWDMCRNGQYTERGIRARHGFGSDRYRIESQYLVKLQPELDLLGVLLEPASVVAKAWEQIGRIGARAHWQPRTVLVTGAGPIGLLAALLGAQRGLEVHVLDRVTDGPKPELVRELGATYHTGELEGAGENWDVVIECTGAAAIFFRAITAAARDGIVCLTGVSSGGGLLKVDAGALNRELVLENNVVFGTVNANRRHYEQAAAALALADGAWLEKLVTRRLPVEAFAEAFERKPGDVKTILTF